MFFITAGLICLNVLLISVSLGAILLDFPQQPEKGYVTNWTDKGLEPGEVHRSQKQLRIQELFLLQRNFVPMILLVLSLAHICTGLLCDVSVIIPERSEFDQFLDFR